MLKVTIRNLLAHKRRLGLTSLAVVLGVSFMVGVQVLGDTMLKTFDDLFADVNEGTDAFVRRESEVESFGQAIRDRVDDDLVGVVAAVPGVAVAEGGVQGFAAIIGADGEPINDPRAGAPSLGFAWTDTEQLNPMRIVAGGPPRADDEIVIDKRSSDRGDLAVGDRAKVITKAGPGEFTVAGVARFGTADSAAGSTITLFTPSEAQRLMAEPGKWDGIAVVADDGVSQEQVKASIASVLPDGVEVVTGQELTEENQNDVRQQIGFFNTFLLVFVVIALFVGIFVILNTFLITLAQRSQELALLRAIGASRRQVLTSVLGEAAILGVVSAGIGVVVGIFLSYGLRAALGAFGLDLPSGDLVIEPATVVIAVVVGLLVTLVAALWPAWRASRVPPVAAMRDVAIDRSGSSHWRLGIGIGITVLGAVLLVLGLGSRTLSQVGFGALVVFVGVFVLGPMIVPPLVKVVGWPLPKLRGIVGALAQQNAARNPNRTALTATALMIGLALVAFITIFADSAKANIAKIVDEAFLGDFVVDSQSFGFGGLNPELAQRVEAVDGVDVATGIRFGFARIDDANTTVTGVDPERIQRLFDVGVIEGSYDRLGVDSIAVDDDVMADKGWQLGDTVEVVFPSGPRTLAIDMVYEENTLAGDYAMSQEGLARSVPDQFDVQVYALLESGADPATVRPAIEAVVADYPTAELRDLTEFKADQEAQINQFLGLIYVLLGLAVLIAFFGIANVLALSIIERRREIGTQRAVGMTRSQLRSIIRWESVVIAVVGVALGMVVALFFSWAVAQALAEEGFTEFTIPWGSLGIMAVLAAVTAVLVSLLPARKASRLDVLQAIATE